jgi:ATP-binding cassette, subfamily B, bacterial
LTGRPLESGALVACSVASGFSQSAVLAAIAEAATAMTSGLHRVSAHLGPLSYNGPVSVVLIAALGFAGLALLLQVAIAYLPTVLSLHVQTDLRERLLQAYTDASWNVQTHEPEGQFQELMTSQSFEASQAALAAAGFVAAAFTFATLVLSALVVSVPVALVVIVCATLLFIGLRPLSHLQQRQSRLLSNRQLDYAASVSETVRVTEEMEVFGTAKALRARVGHLIGITSQLLFRTTLLSRMVSNTYQGLVILMLVLGLAGVYASGVTRVAALGAVVLMLVRAAMYAQQVQGSLQGLDHTVPYVERVENKIELYSANPAVDGPETLEQVQGLAVEKVSFRYQTDRPILRDVSFTVHSGSVTGIVGPSGAGKSTLLRVLLRLCSPDEGSYTVNGLPAEVYSRASWNRQVAYLPQQPRLIQGTVADNIRFFREAEEAAIEAAARLAYVYEEIASLPVGFETVIGQFSDTLSVGQAQRVCLARALVGYPDLLLLDEPTSALDPASEAKIQESLVALKGSVTTLLVAHRPSMLEICDWVIVLVDGRVEKFGPPAEVARGDLSLRRSLPLGAGGG